MSLRRCSSAIAASRSASGSDPRPLSRSGACSHIATNPSFTDVMKAAARSAGASRANVNGGGDMARTASP